MLLFADLKGLGSDAANAALTSSSGYDLPDWIRLWHAYLLSAEKKAAASDTKPATDDKLASLFGEEAGGGAAEPIDARARARAVRLGDLLMSRGAADAALVELHKAFASSTSDPSLRWRFGKSLIASGKDREAAPLFESYEGLDSAHPGWFALAGHFRAELGAAEAARAEADFAMAISLNPYLEDSACEGRFTIRGPDGAPAHGTSPPTPEEPRRRALCESARKIPSE